MEKRKEYSLKNVDGKAMKMMKENMELSNARTHLFLVSGLYTLKESSKTDFSINDLLNASKELYIDDHFVEWLCEYAPYKYSPKKKKLMRDNSKKWRLTASFENPPICKFETIEKILDECGNSYTEKNNETTIYIGAMIAFLDKKISILEEKIDKRIGVMPISNRDLYNETRRLKNKGKSEEEIIKEYIENNPLPDTSHHTGLPQSQYRYGTFGLGSMEYDAWSRS